MLDASHEGHIQADEFLNGCLRLDGPAKAIDLAAFMEESRKAGLPKTRAINAKIATFQTSRCGILLRSTGLSWHM